MTVGFVHPTTGQLQEATEPTLAQALADTDERLGQLHRERRALSGHVTEEIDRLDKAARPLMRALAKLRGPAVLPDRGHKRTSLQRIVAKCPRCGDPLPDEADAA